MYKTLVGGIMAAAAFTLSHSTALAEPEIVSGPAAEADCFAPWAAETKFFKFPKKDGPYRIALANGYIANTWRIQMIQTAKAYAAQPDVAAKLKEFKVVSTGEDVPAQISAINNFIDSGYDAIVVNAQNPTAFGPVIKRAEAGRCRPRRLRQHPGHRRTQSMSTSIRRASAYLWANWLAKHLPDGGKVLEVRGVARHLGRYATVTMAFTKPWRCDRQEMGCRRGCSANGTIRQHRRRPLTRSPCTSKFDGITRAGRRYRRRTGDDRCRTSLRAFRRERPRTASASSAPSMPPRA